MRMLIAVQSCIRDSNNGANQAIRDTWMKDIAGSYDCRFFIGRNVRRALGEEHPNFQKDYRNFQRSKFNPRSEPLIPEFLKGDEVMLSVPDEYSHLTYKFRGICNWALAAGYDYVFKVDTDTYVDTKLLPKQNLRDYVGVHDAGVDYRNGKYVAFAFGGNCFILSKKSMSLLANEKPDILADDAWVGVHLNERGITLRPFVGELTDHLGHGTGQYRWKQMIERYNRRLN